MSDRIPVGIVSDTHNHAWNQFATSDPDGVNSRLRTTLNETKRAAETTRAAGGKVLIHCGDLFHVRGKIAPSVLNPTKDQYRELVEDGFDVYLLAGNHDLETKNSERLNSAITSLEDVGCFVINTPTIVNLSETHRICMVPWFDKIEELKAAITKIGAEARATAPGGSIHDLFIHAPVDGVIPGLPDHGLDSAWLAGLGFDRVFSGHYHNHKAMPGEVYSVGALTHLTWGDVNSKAGFLISDTAGVKYNASHAPEFIEVDASTNPADIPLIVPGNYVKVKINSSKSGDISAVRQLMEDNGAKGVVVISQKVAAAPTRTGATVKAGQSLEGSVASFIDGGEFKDKAKLNTLCADILSTVRVIAS